MRGRTGSAPSCYRQPAATNQLHQSFPRTARGTMPSTIVPNLRAELLDALAGALNPSLGYLSRRAF